MNLKLIKKYNNQIDIDLVNALSQKHNIPQILTKLLILRGIDNDCEIEKFFNPDAANFYDPFLLKGMKQAVERLNEAINTNQRIVVYGDYDADGLCASAILTKYLKSRGIEVFTHIPSRISEGYGLNIESLESIIENINPDLILTCDCGISAANEVAHVLDLGLDIIVTDHHEVPKIAPDCIVVNPKQSDCEYPFSQLCGAGVALKLVHALGGLEECLKYLDLAAIATIADLVPLIDENRLIVQLGLKQIQKKSNPGIKLLIENQNLDTVTAADIAYKIAPRINAAGRMGDAYRALNLFIEEDTAKLSELVGELNSENNRRKELCDKMYKEALEDLPFEDLSKSRAIILSHPKWEKGITGILAARLCNDFKRPSFIIVSSGEVYKGTCRSIQDINIYNLLYEVSDLLIEFGGHSQAAGFSIAHSNIAQFKKRVNEYLLKFSNDLFLPALHYDLELDINDINNELVNSLEQIEPTGHSNTKPLFLTNIQKVQLSQTKSNIAHTLITCENGLNIYAFNHYKYNPVLSDSFKKNFILEFCTGNNNYGGSFRTILRGFVSERFYINDDLARANFIKTLNYSFKETQCKQYDNIDDFSDNIFGTLFIAGCVKTYEKYQKQLDGFVVVKDFMYSQNKNNYTRLIISPEIDENLPLALYERIIFLDSPLSEGYLHYISKQTKAEIYIPKIDNRAEFLSCLDLSRDTFANYFEAFKAAKEVRGQNIYNYYKILKGRNKFLNLPQFVFCVSVFADLGLFDVSTTGFYLKYNKGVQVKLENSKIFSYLKEIING